MHFVHRSYQSDETIAAIATPPGEGGIAVIRISGNDALKIAGKIFSGKVDSYKSHTAHFGTFLDIEGNYVDEGLILVMRAPRSYTGEDTVELFCHGGSLITKRVLECALNAGAKAAGPGEFTYRAFKNGKLDLAQAEAVQELISSKNEMALNMAEQQLQGALSKKIISLQAALVDVAAILEAWVDFPEEGLEFASQEEIIAILETTLANMQKLIATFHDGKMIHEGFNLCLAGPPNAGKSSLMNALLGKERAIVTNIAGTTRDLLEEEMRMGGLHFRIADTAGIRETEEIIEKEGIKRSREAMGKADLVLLVMDASKEMSWEEKQLLDSAPASRTLLIWNKIDLADAPSTGVAISAKTGEGLDALREAIEKLLWKNGLPSKEEVVITNFRHKQALVHASEACMQLIEGLQTGVSPEFLSFEMRKMLTELGTIIGSDITEDILSAIFSKFCVGK